MACAVLHNCGTKANLPEPDIADNVQEDNNPNVLQNQNGIIVRRNIINNVLL